VRRILFEGQTGAPENDLRRLVVERHGASPSRARAEQAVATLQAVLRERGYAQAKIAVRVEGENPANAAMIFAIQAGRRARIADIGLQGPLPHQPRRCCER
jgi:outer membrane protein assembly factor BamA